MNGATISSLRRRMIEDMTVRKFVEKTQKDYIRHVKGLTIFLRRSPATATAEALRFFFSITLDRPEVTKRLTFVAEPRKIPVVLSPEEVTRFLDAAPGP